MRVAVTGAAGFIASHLSDRLLKAGHSVLGIDNLCAGFRSNLPRHKRFSFKKLDIRNLNSMLKALKGADAVFHFAADPMVKESAEKPIQGFGINVRGTLNVLEASRRTDVKSITFASTSAVYGEAKEFPTPETHPLSPISNYAASKISAESYICAYSSTYGLKGTVLRYANIFGPRSHHGVMHDFFFKLKKNPGQLLILGNGKQTKSYLYVSDCVEASVLASRRQRRMFDFFNVGSDRTASVNDIADNMGGILGLSPKYSYTGGDRGWVGDVPRMRLDVRKIKRLTGWSPKVSLRGGMKSYADWLSSL